MDSLCNKDDVMDVLWDSLAGGTADLIELKQKVNNGVALNELGLDSLDMVDYYLRLQDKFDIDISSDDFAQLNSFSEIAAFINSRKQRE
jgi:acyl carrier protein